MLFFATASKTNKNLNVYQFSLMVSKMPPYHKKTLEQTFSEMYKCAPMKEEVVSLFFTDMGFLYHMRGC